MKSILLTLLRLVFVVSLLFGLAPSADASPFTFNFTGTVIAADALLAPNILSGDLIAGSYTFESTTPPDVFGPNLRGYPAITSLTVTVGSYTLSDMGGYIGVLDNAGFDSYKVETSASPSGLPLAGYPLGSFVIGLYDYSSMLISGLSLPTVPPDPSMFNQANWSIAFGSGNPSAWGQIDSLTLAEDSGPGEVPEPASLLLLGTGLGAIAVRLRRRIASSS